MIAAAGPEIGGLPVAAWVLIDIAIIVVVARLVGRLFVRMHQPAVVGEILAGIMLGPTLLGLLPGDLPALLFPDDARPYLEVVAQLGLVVFMLLVGLELDLTLIRGKERLAAVISATSVVLPFVLGAGLAVVLWQYHNVVKGEDVRLLPFALFIGAAMAVTAFPVLARILSERGMQKTSIGALTLACAAVDDVLAWSLLALVFAVVKSESPTDVLVVFGLSVVFVAVMFTIVKPQLARLAGAYARSGKITSTIFSVVMVGALTSAFITEWIGIHAIFGAFLFGVIMPRRDSVAMNHDLFERLEGIAVLLLLPVFFIVSGLEVNLPSVGVSGLWQLAAIIAVAVTGKFAGALIAGRLQGLPNRKAATIGVLMNTRGLTELVILNVGLNAGVLSPELFSLMVVMAIVTTVMTEPLLRVVYPDRMLARDIADAERISLGESTYRAVAWVEPDQTHSPRTAAAVATASAMVAGTPDGQVVLVAAVPQLPDLELASGLGGELALMAQTVESLQGLAGQATALGVRSTVRAHFAVTAIDDLHDQVAAVHPEVIVTAMGEPDGANQLATSLDADVVIVATTINPASATGIHAHLTGGLHDAAVVEYATRISLATHQPLTLTDSSRSQPSRQLVRLADRLCSMGVAATAQAPDTLRTAAFAVVAADSPTEHLDDAIVVAARPELGRQDPLERIERLGLVNQRNLSADPVTGDV